MILQKILAYFGFIFVMISSLYLIYGLWYETYSKGAREERAHQKQVEKDLLASMDKLIKLLNK